MGHWFVDFLASQGFDVEVADPAGPVEGYPHRARWEDSPLDHDVIVVASPLGITAEVLKGLAARRPRGLVFDLASVKTPLREGLRALVAAGVRTASIHPMFGPDTDLLSGRHVIYIDLGDPAALAEAQELFAPTMAERVVTGLDEHDRLIAYVLGLSHALNIAFFTALAESGEAAPRLARMSSTTFDAQLDVARRVAEDSPALYFEIQALNEYGTESLTALLFAVERLRATVRAARRGRVPPDDGARPDLSAHASAAGSGAGVSADAAGPAEAAELRARLQRLTRRSRRQRAEVAAHARARARAAARRYAARANPGGDARARRRPTASTPCSS